MLVLRPILGSVAGAVVARQCLQRIQDARLGGQCTARLRTVAAGPRGQRAASWGKMVGEVFQGDGFKKWLESADSSTPAGGAYAPGGRNIGSAIGYDDPYGRYEIKPNGHLVAVALSPLQPYLAVPRTPIGVPSIS